MNYGVYCTIETDVEAESPEEAALEFARLLEEGNIHLSDVADRDEDETLAEVGISEETADGREITYHVAVGNRIANVRWVTEGRPFRYSDAPDS